jgi:hypothetical protein
VFIGLHGRLHVIVLLHAPRCAHEVLGSYLSLSVYAIEEPGTNDSVIPSPSINKIRISCR